MLCLSSKKSLLSGVSAVVLATTVGVSAVGVSEALAQVTYTHSSGVFTWADTDIRTPGRDGNLRNAASGDNLTLGGGTVNLDYNTLVGRRSIGILRSGTAGAGTLLIEPGTGDFTVNIGEIVKQGNQAVDLNVKGNDFLDDPSSLTLNVTRGATVRDLTVDMGNGRNRTNATVTYNGNLTVEGTTQITAGNSSASTDATLVLKGAENKFAGDLTLNDQTNGNAFLTISGSSNQTIGRVSSTGTNRIKAASDGEGTIRVLNGRADLAPREATFDIQIGHDEVADANDRRLGQLTVGEAVKGGHAIFNEAVHVDKIDVIAGNDANEKATAEFRSEVTGDSITLNDNGAGKATVIFNATNGDKSVGLTIDGASAGEGQLSVYDDDNGAPDTITFTNEIGGTHKLSLITVGGNNFAGSAIFKQDVSATNLKISGGDATGENSEVTMSKGDLTANVNLANNTGSAKLTIGSRNGNSGERTLDGDITVANDGDGTVEVELTLNSAGEGFVFDGQIGTQSAALGTLNVVEAGSLGVDFKGKVYAQNITIDSRIDGNSTRGRDGQQADFYEDVVSGSSLIVKRDVTFRKDVTANKTGTSVGFQFQSAQRRDTSGNIVPVNEGRTATFSGVALQTVTGEITTAVQNKGNLSIENTQGVTFKNNVGTSAAKLDNITLANNAKATFEGSVYLANGLNLGQNGQITLNGTAAQVVAGNLTTAANNRGKLTITNAAGVTFNNQIGAGPTDASNASTARQLQEISVGSATEAGKATFKQDVFAGQLNISGGDAAGENSEVAIENNLTGNVTLADNTGSAKLIIAGVSGRAIVRTLDGDITVANDGEGTVEVVLTPLAGNERMVFEGQIGQEGAALGLLDVDSAGQGVQFKRDVYAKKIDTDAATYNTSAGSNFGANVAFEGHVVSDSELIVRRTVVFKGNVTANKTTTGGTTSAGFQFAQSNRLRTGENSDSLTAYFRGTTEPQIVTGEITTAVQNKGNFSIENTQGVTFKNNVGTSAAKLDKITLANNAKATLEGSAQFANASTIGAGATLTIGGAGRAADVNGAGQEISGDFGGDGTIVVDNRGDGGTGRENNNTVTFNDDVTVVNLNVNDGATAFDGNVNVTNVTVNSADGTTFKGNVAGQLTFGEDVQVTFDGSAAQSFANAVTTATDAQGTITVANTNGVTFRGDLGTNAAKLASLTLNAGTTATLEKSGYFGGNVSIGNTATLIIGDASTVTGTNGRGTSIATEQTITGNIVAGGDGQGTLEIRNRSTDDTGQKVSLNGTIGAEGAALDTITVADGQTTFGGNVYASNLKITSGDGTAFKGDVSTDTFEFGDGSTATFNGTAKQTITGDLTSATGGHYGDITIANSAGVVFAGSLGTSTAKLASLTVNEDAKVTFHAPVYLSGNLTLNKNSTLTLGSAFGERTGADARASFLTIGGDVDFGDADAENKVTLVLPVSFTTGTQKLINKDLSAELGRKLAIGESTLVNYAFDSDGMTLMATAKGFKSATEVAAKLGVTSSEATTMLAATSAVASLPDASPVKQLLQEVAQAGNEAKAKRLAEQLVPQTTALSGVATAVVSTGTQVAGVFSNRLSAQRSGGGFAATEQSGFATGGHGMNRAFWLRPFGSWGKQSKNTKQKIAGYRTRARGLVVGVDAPVGDTARVGTAVAYSTSTITGKGAGQDKTDVKSWQVALYGDYSTARYYVEGQLGLGRNDVSTASQVAFLTRKADYDTTSLMASVGGGLPLTLTPGTTLTPTAGLSWTRVGSANYTTRGASALNQKIAVGAIDAVVGRLGTQLQRKITRNKGTLIPTARVGLSYDFAGEQTTASGTFTGGGTPFTVKGAKPKKLSGTAGLGLTYATPRWSIGAEYDLTTRPGYQGHTARLNAKVTF